MSRPAQAPAEAPGHRLDLAIVIPAFDEEARIGGALEETRRFLDGRAGSAEVVVVDDGSLDSTCAIVERHAAEDPRVRLLRLGRNRGKGAAVRAGVLATRARRVLFMDADLATPLEELARLEDAMDRGADVAIGSRAIAGSRILTHQHPLREWGGRVFNLMVQAVAVPGIWDTQCGFKLFSREAADALFSQATIDRFAFDVEILLLARGRFRVAEIPVAWRHVERSKVSPLRDGVKTALDLIKVRIQVALRRTRGG